jgi:conjugative transfer signal peptidase TraF
VEGEEEHPVGGRFNRLLLIVIVAIAMIVDVVAAQGIRSAGVSSQSGGTQPADDGADAARNKAKVEELAAGSARRVVAVVAVTIAGAAALAAIGRFFHLRITITDSAAPAGVYRVSEVPAGRGALVAACLPAAIARTGIARGYLREGDCPAGAEPVAKVMGAVAGDVVDLEPGWVAVNGVKFSNSQTAARDSARRPLSHVRSGAHGVSAGEVWLFGFNDARSWDARYFGPVPRAGVRGVLSPVVTW